MELKARIMDETAVHRALVRISHEIVERNRGAQNLVLVGVKSRGEPLAEMIRDNILAIEDRDVPFSSIDIHFYRDDLTHPADFPVVRSAALPFSVEGKTVIIVDDVLYTGRTARAAIDAVFSQGRPACVQLAVLIDRGHRELSIRADFVGKNVPTSHTEMVEVHVPPADGDTGVFLMDLTSDHN